MKRLSGVFIGAFALVLTLAGPAFAGSNDYPTSPSPTTIVEGSGGGTGGTAFTGANVSTAIAILAVLAVIGVVALLVARRRAAHEA